ncbi:MAG: ABC transporter ATP-binding protein [Anaerolineae bacterium]
MAPLLEVEDLRVVFPTPRGTVRAVWGVSFRIEKGQMYGIVGESGCGKSATGRAILRLIPPPGKIVGGQVLFRGENLLGKSEEEMQQVRGRSISMIFQDPAAALNPLFTIGQQITAIMKRHKVAHGEELRRRAEQLFEELGLPHSQDLLQCYPHQLSGGMQQRVMIAMALCVESDLLIADEPTSCLDVTIQSQILDLLVRLQKQRRLAIMLITHDLGVVAETCERVAVFYLGRIVEQGAVSDVFRHPRHPYTQGLLAALPDPQRWGSPLKMIPGSVPTPLEPIPGCAFATRCEFRMEMCRHVEPQLVSVGDDHLAACFLYAADPGKGQGRA